MADVVAKMTGDWLTPARMAGFMLKTKSLSLVVSRR
jgi:hypothetical protein